jgi:hypothetical protein
MVVQRGISHCGRLSVQHYLAAAFQHFNKNEKITFDQCLFFKGANG